MAPQAGRQALPLAALALRRDCTVHCCAPDWAASRWCAGSASGAPIGEDPAPPLEPVPAVWACADVSFAAAAPADVVGVLDVDDDPTPPTALPRHNAQAQTQVQVDGEPEAIASSIVLRPEYYVALDR
jgi:hypothetical protein